MWFTKLRPTAVMTVLALQLATTVGAEPTGGPKHDVHRVRARGSDSFEIMFRGGQDALVAIDGDGDTDLDLYVYDEHGFLVGSDTDGTDTCIVRFTPRWTGRFTIVVRNLGYVSNVYEIAAL